MTVGVVPAEKCPRQREAFSFRKLPLLGTMTTVIVGTSAYYSCHPGSADCYRSKVLHLSLSENDVSLSQEHGLSGADSNSMLCMLCMLCCRIMPSLDQLAPEHEELGEIGCERDNLLAQG